MLFIFKPSISGKYSESDTSTGAIVTTGIFSPILMGLVLPGDL